MKQTAILLGGFFAVFVLFSPTVFAAPIVPGSFSTTWDTGALDTVSVRLGVCPTAVYWEELSNATNNGTSSTCVGSDTVVEFPSPGQYRVDYSGSFTSISFGEFWDAGDVNRTMFRSVEQWGSSSWSSLSAAFAYVTDLTFNASDVPDLSQTTVTSVMFHDATNFNSDISNWDLSNVTDAWGMFMGATAFNQPLNDWDVSANIRFWRMFQGATAFNQPLNNWDVSSGEEFTQMFEGATSFNQPLNNWDTSNGVYMESMFAGATAFNQSVANFDFTNVDPSQGLQYFFYGATSFNQPLDTWNVSGIQDMREMFSGASSFNQPLDTWNVSNVTDMVGMFSGATAFNQPLNSWNIANVSDMTSLFQDAASFNQPLDLWDVSNVTTMYSMFEDATSFNQSLDSWDVSKVSDMTYMFQNASAFNQQLGDWEIGQPCSGGGGGGLGMLFNLFFQTAHACIGGSLNLDSMLTGSGLDSRNYATTLIGWAALPVIPNNVTLAEVSTAYCDTAQIARDTLIASGWIITDEGAVPCASEEVSSSGSSGTRVGERIKSYFSGTTTSSSSVASVISVTKESFIESVRNFIEYLTQNEADLEKLTPEESTKIIVGLRDILVFLLTLLPGI